MKPAARVAAAADILDKWRGGEERAEALLRRWGRENRYAGSKDRRAISDIVYDCLRCLRSYGWLGEGEDGRALTLGRAMATAGDPADVFTGDGHAPDRLSPSEARRVATVGEDPSGVLADAPIATRLDFPDWLIGSLEAALGAELEAAMSFMRERAPTDLRVNRLRADADAARAALAEHDPSLLPETVSGATDALRLPPGARIAGARALEDGLVELQDAASQAGAALAAPKAGETILDYCAGGGGKALAFASITGGDARVVAHDVAPERMRDLPERARRAGARIEIARTEDLGRLYGACDLVFVDAPCSGSGVWRRDPEAKWRLSPTRLDALRAAQAEAARAACAFLRPGGRLAYATCSLLPEENEAQVDALIAKVSPAQRIESRLWLPGEPGDGFFCAIIGLGALKG